MYDESTWRESQSGLWTSLMINYGRNNKKESLEISLINLIVSLDRGEKSWVIISGQKGRSRNENEGRKNSEKLYRMANSCAIRQIDKMT